MFSEKYCDEYYMSLVTLNPTYVWGANMEKATSEVVNKLYKTFGNKQYNLTYYQNKLLEAASGSGLISDCSGMIYPISKKDNTSKGYFSACLEKGKIDSFDPSHSCLLFRGTSPNTITHVGYYCSTNGEVMEMASSKLNFQHKKFNRINWNFWGKPSFIDYSPTPSNKRKDYCYKGIDVSGYQTQIDYNECKKAGLDFAILKIIRKDMTKDKMFEEHWKNFTSVNIPIFAVYNYSYATTVDKAEYDAQTVLSILDGRKVAICLDVEDKCQAGLGSLLIEIINSYQEIVESAGYPFILYSGLAFYNANIKPFAAKLKCKNFWIARYYNGYQMMDFSDEPDQKFKPMENIIGWQYTSSGHLNKCPGNYDFDIIYSDISKPQIPKTNSSPIVSHVKTSGANLNVRNKPIDGQVCYKLKNGAIANIVGVDESTGWFRLSFNNEEWISPQYVSSGQFVKVVANMLNVRDSDSIIGKSLKIVKKGEQFEVYAQSANTDWYLTKYGWISNKFVERI